MSHDASKPLERYGSRSALAQGLFNYPKAAFVLFQHQ
jgi:hypothetical protein